MKRSSSSSILGRPLGPPQRVPADGVLTGRKSTGSNSAHAPLKEMAVQTAIRIRPFLNSEDPASGCLYCPDRQSVRIANSRNAQEAFHYQFDACFDQNADQGTVFHSICPPIIDRIFHGHNATIFTYGITGAGKTYTMDGTPEHRGIVSRAVEYIFFKMEKSAAAKSFQFQCRVSHLEIYNEKVFDLMAAKQTPPMDLAIRQDADGNIHIAGLSETVIRNVGEFERFYSKSRHNRSTASTLLNSTSSRSHSVLCLSLERINLQTHRKICTKLYLIDLAGSEDNRKTGNNKDRMVESGSINRSLFMLSQVVDALNNNSVNIPYRNSKLTRLLQDSLGGRAAALMILNVAPGKQFYLDTLNSLNIARKTRSIIKREEVVSVQKGEDFVTSGVQPIRSPRPEAKTHEVTVKENAPPEKDFTGTKPSDSALAWSDLLPHATPGTRKGILKAYLNATHGVSPTANCSTSIEDDDDVSVRRPTKKPRTALLAAEKQFNTNIDIVLPSPVAVNPATGEKKKRLQQVLPDLPPEIMEDMERKSDAELLDLLNEGNVKKITSLRGIGLVRAKQIIDYRLERGQLASLGDLREVGISEKVLGNIRRDFLFKKAEESHQKSG